MRKLLATLAFATAIAATPAVALAPQIDYAALTDDELHELIDSARIELTTRELVASEDVVLVDVDGVQLYLTCVYDVHGEGRYVDFAAVMVNGGEGNRGVAIDEAYINGWEVYGSSLGSIDAGKKQKGDLTFKLEDADISSFEEIEEIEIHFYVYNGDTYETLVRLDPVTLHFTADGNGFEEADD